MINTNNRQLNLNELAMVTGGIRINHQKESSCDNICKNSTVGIPLYRRVQIRVR